MPAPWVVYDSTASYGGDCAARADPDIAGVGVGSRTPTSQPYVLITLGGHILCAR
jgi:hypothetical protein